MRCYLYCLYMYLCLLCALLCRVTSTAAAAATASITCAAAGDARVKTIPPERINDGYCDCPFDGLDEPETEACSGATVGGWAGLGMSVQAPGQEGVKFTCPQEPNLALPVSRINDGICDCCDGADETDTAKCVDVCEQVLRAQREERKLLETSFRKGNARRLAELSAFQLMIEKTERKFQALTVEHTSLESQLTAVEQEIQQLKHDQLKRRILAVRDTIMSLSHAFQTKTDDFDTAPLRGLLEPLSEEGLVTVIVQACQLAGEQDTNTSTSTRSSGNNKKPTTCVPLRMAGLEVGIVWGDENYKEATVTERERLNLASTEWQELLDRNMAAAASNDETKLVWSLDNNDKSNKANKKQGNNDRRRLMEEHDFDDDMAYSDEDWEDDEDYLAEDVGDDYYYELEDGKQDEEMNPELLNNVKAFAFSAARLSFLNRATHLIERIDALLNDSGNDENDDEKEEKQQEGDDRLNAPTKVDPVALQQVRTTLKRRKESIERGFKYAVSAEILVKPVEGSHQDLVALAAGTLYHGNIRSSDLWQILAYMTVEFPTHACFSPWSILCPPQMSEHNGNPFPPLPIVEAVKHYCQDGRHTDSSIICDTDVDEAIPTSIHDHYYGYTVIEPRDENDVLSKAFARLDHLGDRSEISKLEGKRDELKKQQKDLSRRMQELEDQMGGRDHSKYGNQGELYSLRDSCHSVQEGKYDYEVCIFGRASQNEHGSKSGTQLGRWDGIKIDPETGKRKLEWTHGAKCWNGPERSATVFVTCGAENKVLSAQEPDTCRYVLEMESYIACDDDYKQRHGL